MERAVVDRCAGLVCCFDRANYGLATSILAEIGADHGVEELRPPSWWRGRIVGLEPDDARGGRDGIGVVYRIALVEIAPCGRRGSVPSRAC